MKLDLIKAPKGIKDETFRNVLSAAISAYQYLGRVPTVADIAKYCSHQPGTIAKIIGTSEFLWAIDKNGINWPGETQRITPEQQYVLSVLTNPSDRRDLSKKLKSCGVPYSRYRAWLKQPLFSAQLNQITESMLTEHQGDVHTAFLNRALTGDMQAIKFYYELTGRHNPAQKQVVDLQRLVGLLLEIITRNVQDPVVLQRISSEIESVVTGQTKAIERQLPPNPVGDLLPDVTDAEVVEEENVFNF